MFSLVDSFFLFQSRTSSLKDAVCWFTFWCKLCTSVWAASSLREGRALTVGIGMGVGSILQDGPGSCMHGKGKGDGFSILVTGSSVSSFAQNKNFGVIFDFSLCPYFTTCQPADPACSASRAHPNSDHSDQPHLNRRGPGHLHPLPGLS